MWTESIASVSAKNSIKGYYSFHFLYHRTNPFAELRLKDFGLKKGKKRIERIVRRNLFQIREYLLESDAVAYSLDADIIFRRG